MEKSRIYHEQKDDAMNQRRRSFELKRGFHNRGRGVLLNNNSLESAPLMRPCLTAPTLGCGSTPLLFNQFLLY